MNIEADTNDNQLEITVEIEDGRYKKHFIGLSDSDTLKQHIEEFNQRAYQKYSVEELLKENTSKKG